MAIAATAALGLAGFSLAAGIRESVTPGTQGSFVAASDVRLAYREWGPSSGFPVLLVHGSFAWSQTWDVIAPALAAQGFRVIALDIPPFGYSQRPANGSYSRKAQARRILSAADALGLSAFALVGHSFGAGAAVEAAFEAPERVEAMALLSAALALDDPSGGGAVATAVSIPILGHAITAGTFANPLFTGAGLRAFVHEDTVVTPERTALYQAPLEVQGTAGAVTQWLVDGLYGDERSSKAANPLAYRAFARPTLLIWGLQDTVTPVEQGRALDRILPQSRLVELKGVGHIPHLEAPAAVAGELSAFLDRIRQQQ